jgi:hypothetical protein
MTEHKNIHMALVAAQAEMGGVKKGSVNPAFKSKYADLSDVVAAVSGPLNAQGIAFYHVPATLDGERVMWTFLSHGASETKIECAVPLIIGKQDMQGYKSASTYAKRIGLESLTGVAPEDDDGNAAAKAAPRYIPTVSVAPLDANGKSNKEIKEAYERLSRMLANCSTLDDMEGWLEISADDRDDLPEDMHESLRGAYKRKRDELKAVAT